MRLCEYFREVACTQELNSPHRLTNFDVRRQRSPGRATPSSGPARSVELREPLRRAGRYHPAHIGLSLWRLRSYSLSQVTARPLAGHPGTLFSFSPLGIDAPLFGASESGPPEPLRRARCAADLQRPAPERELFGMTPVFSIQIAGTSISPEELLIADLRQPLYGRQLPTQAKVAVDPERGRLQLLNVSKAKAALPEVTVSYSYGFSAELGGGPYLRPIEVFNLLRQNLTGIIGVSRRYGQSSFGLLSVPACGKR